MKGMVHVVIVRHGLPCPSASGYVMEHGCLDDVRKFAAHLRPGFSIGLYHESVPTDHVWHLDVPAAVRRARPARAA